MKPEAFLRVRGVNFGMSWKCLKKLAIGISVHIKDIIHRFTDNLDPEQLDTIIEIKDFNFVSCLKNHCCLHWKLCTICWNTKWIVLLENCSLICNANKNWNLFVSHVNTFLWNHSSCPTYCFCTTNMVLRVATHFWRRVVVLVNHALDRYSKKPI